MNMKHDQLPMGELPAFFEDMVHNTEPQAKPGIPEVNRRQFFKLSGIAGGGLVLGLSSGASQKAKAQATAADVSSLSPYVQIQTNGRINIFSKNTNKAVRNNGYLKSSSSISGSFITTYFRGQIYF